jgi:hypothetical protein
LFLAGLPARRIGRLERRFDVPDRKVVEVQRVAVPGVQRVEVQDLLGDAVDGLRVDDMNALFAAEAKYFLINNPGTDGDFDPGLCPA